MRFSANVYVYNCGAHLCGVSSRRIYKRKNKNGIFLDPYYVPASTLGLLFSWIFFFSVNSHNRSVNRNYFHFIDEQI